ncbi:MAG TPA: mandelate racemase [Rhodospirillaceae bacterium]|nr:mandelate racemase [Rhodospirillaceae bacterium]
MDRTPTIDDVSACAYRIPTDAPEADGTLAWTSTTVVVVTATAGGRSGLGYSYTHAAAASLINTMLNGVVAGGDAMAVATAWQAMIRAVRNIGLEGLAATAISAVDIALWDLKGKLLDLPLAQLLGPVRWRVPVYGSGGFTSYPLDRLEGQLAGWAGQGIRMVKMKVGSTPDQDLARVSAARRAIGPAVQLFVDANGAYDRPRALAMAEAFSGEGVVWFEEPVSSDDLIGLGLIRDRAPAGMAVAAGEYGYTPWYFRRMLEAGAVDVLQADATRCLGISGFLKVGAVCEAFGLPMSAHTAPSMHLHPCCALPSLRHIEWFHDHARIEEMIFDGTPIPRDGDLQADAGRPGLGLELKQADAAKWMI